MKIFTSSKDKYDYKIVRCGDYLQIYYYPGYKVKKNIKKLDIDDLKKEKIKDILNDNSVEQLSLIENVFALKEKKIEDRNIIRTKLNCQRLAKSNINSWCSFITLTYAENMQDISKAKKDFHYFVKNIQKKKANFKYISIIEFQDRGAIHFHLLSNLSRQDNYIITKQKDNNKFYDVKYWHHGFTSYEEITGDVKKIIGYISKYMTKECDNRLFGFCRYTYSRNLIKPVNEYLNLEKEPHNKYLINILEGKELIYSNVYKDNYNNEVNFEEYKVI